MSVLDRLKQFPAVVTDGVKPTFTTSGSDINPTTGGEKSEKTAYDIDSMDVDLEAQKPIGVDIKLGEKGAQRIELMQQVWGKHGKKYTFTAYEITLHPFIVYADMVSLQIGTLHGRLGRIPHPSRQDESSDSCLVNLTRLHFQRTTTTPFLISTI